MVRSEPLKRTTEEAMKLAPLTVRVNWASPAVLEVGEIEVVVGTGLLVLRRMETSSLNPFATAKSKTVLPLRSAAKTEAGLVPAA